MKVSSESGLITCIPGAGKSHSNGFPELSPATLAIKIIKSEFGLEEDLSHDGHPSWDCGLIELTKGKVERLNKWKLSLSLNEPVPRIPQTTVGATTEGNMTAS